MRPAVCALWTQRLTIEKYAIPRFILSTSDFPIGAMSTCRKNNMSGYNNFHVPRLLMPIYLHLSDSFRQPWTCILPLCSKPFWNLSGGSPCNFRTNGQTSWDFIYGPGSARTLDQQACPFIRRLNPQKCIALVPHEGIQHYSRTAVHVALSTNGLCFCQVKMIRRSRQGASGPKKRGFVFTRTDAFR